MDNQKAFDVAVKTKINLVESLLKHYDKIYLHNICEDNHAGAFGYVVNSAVKMYLEAKHPNVVVTNQRKLLTTTPLTDSLLLLRTVRIAKT